MIRIVLCVLISSIVSAIESSHPIESAPIHIKTEKIIEFSIPWPSGIMVDKAIGRPISASSQDGGSLPQNEIFRVGRNQHNVIAMRPQWSSIYVMENVLSDKRCKNIIKRAETRAAVHGWSRGRHIDYDIRPTQDLTFMSLYQNSSSSFSSQASVSPPGPDSTYHKIMSLFQTKIIDQFSKKFGLDDVTLRIDDLFVTKYDSQLQPKHMLGPHKDKSLWSFVVPLNDDFEGGGTYFFDVDELWKPPKGGALVFSGQNLHGGSPITKGVRYILAGFVDSVDPNSHEEFMKLYDSRYDGYAASVGFRTGDIIIGIEACYPANRSTGPLLEELEVQTASGEATSVEPSVAAEVPGEGVERRWVSITPTTSDEEWLQAAQSCEGLAPGSPTAMRVRRLV